MYEPGVLFRHLAWFETDIIRLLLIPSHGVLWASHLEKVVLMKSGFELRGIQQFYLFFKK